MQSFTQHIFAPVMASASFIFGVYFLFKQLNKKFDDRWQQRTTLSASLGMVMEDPSTYLTRLGSWYLMDQLPSTTQNTTPMGPPIVHVSSFHRDGNIHIERASSKNPTFMLSLGILDQGYVFKTAFVSQCYTYTK